MGIPVVWKDALGYEGLYQVSNTGKIKSLFRYKKELKPNITRGGYATVELFKDKKSKRLLIHRIVAFAFIENASNLPQVNHIDENKLNNNVENLEWQTAKENMNYGTRLERQIKNTDFSKNIYKENARKNGKVVSKSVLQFDKMGNFLNRYDSGKEASKKTNLNHSHIMECCAGKRYKSVGGFIWKYERGNDLLAFLV